MMSTRISFFFLFFLFGLYFLLCFGKELEAVIVLMTSICILTLFFLLFISTGRL